MNYVVLHFAVANSKFVHPTSLYGYPIMATLIILRCLYHFRTIVDNATIPLRVLLQQIHNSIEGYVI